MQIAEQYMELLNLHLGSGKLKQAESVRNAKSKRVDVGRHSSSSTQATQGLESSTIRSGNRGLVILYVFVRFGEAPSIIASRFRSLVSSLFCE